MISDVIDTERANPARMYDYYLGGSHNFAADRELADRAIARFPRIVRSAQANRAFLARAVRYCLSCGVDQFLDLGSGIPTVGNVHEVARRIEPAVRVAYVDNEAVAVAHGRALLDHLDGVTVTMANLRDVDDVLTAPGVTGVLDFHAPLAVLMVAVLHFVPESDDPAGIITAYRDAMPPGSLLALSHVSDDLEDPEFAAANRAIAEIYKDSSTPVHLRDRASLHRMLAGFDLAEPGLVEAVHWRAEEPDRDAAPCGFYAAVGHRS